MWPNFQKQTQSRKIILIKHLHMMYMYLYLQFLTIPSFWQESKSMKFGIPKELLLSFLDIKFPVQTT